MAEKRVIIVCGEVSGDIHAANLAEKILTINPDIKICAVGGACLRKTGAEIFYDIKDLSVIGLFDVIKNLPKFFALKKLLLEKIKEERPDLIILVDFSGFNLRLAKAINKAVPIIYYISPQVWASRPGRIKTIKEYIQKIIVFFKFEKELYLKHGINAEFVGHPLLDIAQPVMNKKQFINKFGLSGSKITVALLPGSRRQELKYILPVMLNSAGLISEKIKNIQFVIAKPAQLDWDIYNQSIIRYNKIELRIVEDRTYDCLEAADFCMVASGTATLETAIMQKPFIIIYKISPLNYFLYRPQIKVNYIGMVNIIAKRKIIPEFIQSQATAQKIFSEVKKILENRAELERIKNELSQIRPLLGEKGASLRAAQIVVDYLNSS